MWQTWIRWRKLIRVLLGLKNIILPSLLSVYKSPCVCDYLVRLVTIHAAVTKKDESHLVNLLCPQWIDTILIRPYLNNLEWLTDAYSAINFFCTHLLTFWKIPRTRLLLELSEKWLGRTPRIILLTLKNYFQPVLKILPGLCSLDCLNSSESQTIVSLRKHLHRFDAPPSMNTAWLHDSTSWYMPQRNNEGKVSRFWETPYKLLTAQSFQLQYARKRF